MKKLPLYLFLVLMFSLFTSNTFAEVKYKSYKKFPCSFNGAKVDTSAIISFKSSSRCSKYTGYPLKRGTSILVERSTPIFAITDMKLIYAKNRSAKQRCKIYNKTHEEVGCDYIFDDVELMFEEKNGNQILFYHLMSTPFVPGFGKGKCERPLEFGTEKWKRDPKNCGGYSEDLIARDFFIKKGELIGYSGTTGSNQSGDEHISFSFIINPKNLNEKEKKLCDIQVKKNFEQKDCKKWKPIYCYECYLAPEARKNIFWENYPKNPNAYLLPVLSKKYLKEIVYYK